MTSVRLLTHLHLFQRQFRRKTGAEELQGPSWRSHAAVLRSLPGELLWPLRNMSGVRRRKTSGFACPHLVQSLQHPLEVSMKLSLCFWGLIDFENPAFLRSWNEWLRLPVKYPDLPQNAQVALTVWDIYGPGRAIPVGGTTVTLFGKYGWAESPMRQTREVFQSKRHQDGPASF